MFNSHCGEHVLQIKNSHMEPAFRKKHLAKDKKKDKGPVYASKKHVRIELENQWRHEKKTARPASSLK
jgi:hypothetical protein